MAKANKEQTQTSVKKAATKLSRDSKFLYRLCERIGAAGVTGEKQNRLVIYLACLTCVLEKVVSVLVKSPTATGKNNQMRAGLSLVAPEKILTRTSFSNTALAYGSDELAGKILYIVEHRAGRDAQLFTRLLQSEGALQHEVTIAGGKTKVAARVGAPVFLSQQRTSKSTPTTRPDSLVYEQMKVPNLRAKFSVLNSVKNFVEASRWMWT